MPERINTPYTSEHFVAFCLAMLGQPYWYGTCVYKCTESLRSKKANQYPSHYADSRTSRYKQDIAAKKVCADCVGLIKGYNWTKGGIGVIESVGTDNTFSSKYGNNTHMTIRTQCNARDLRQRVNRTPGTALIPGIGKHAVGRLVRAVVAAILAGNRVVGTNGFDSTRTATRPVVTLDQAYTVSADLLCGNVLLVA